MDEFEEKLNSILSSPETMGQIMALANSLSGQPQSNQEDTESEQGAQAPQAPQAKAPDLSGLFQGMDPAMLQKLMTLWGEFNRGGDEKTRLLQAMRPFLREERQAKLDKAMQIARLSRVIRSAIEQIGGEGHV